MRSLFYLAIISAVVVAALGCISTPQQKLEVPTLRIGYQPSTHHIAEIIAADKGWWQQDLAPLGVIDVKEFQFPSGPPEMQAMLAGDLDVAYVGTSPPISAISQGLDAKIVAGISINGSNLVLRNGLNYDGPGSLIGLSIGTFPPGSIQDIILRRWLRHSGINASLLRIIPMGPGDAIAAISAGRVDGVFLPQPGPAVIELEGKGRSVLAAGTMWPDHAANSLVVSGRLIRERPDLVRQIIRTHINATDYANANSEEAARIYANRTGDDIRTIDYSIKTWDGRWIADPNIQVPSTLEYAAVNYQLNYTTRQLTRDDLFYTELYNNTI